MVIRRWSLSILTAVTVLLGVAAPAMSSTADQTSIPGTAADVVDCRVHPHGIFLFLEQGPIYDMYFAMADCGLTPTIPIDVQYHGSDGRPYWRAYCAGVGLTKVGWKQYNDAAANLTGEYLTGTRNTRHHCERTEIPVPPRPGDDRSRATGMVEIPRNSGGEHMRGMSGARVELKFFGTAGPGTLPAWRPVTTGPAGTGRPVVDHLDERGRYDLEFRYPNRQPNPGGGEWGGCPIPADPIPHMGAHACADEHVILEVYPEDEERGVRVFEPEQTEIKLAAAAFVGEYFKHPDRKTTASSAAAHAYAGVMNVKDVVGSWAPVEVRLHASVHPNYEPWRKRINLTPAEAFTSTTEHEAAHHAEYIRTGTPSAPGCQDHSLGKPSNPHCAWQEGFATFLGVVAENRPGHDDWTSATRPGGWVWDVERCATGWTAQRLHRCPESKDAEDRSGYEAWVAAALWDLYDNTPLEVENGHRDTQTRALSAILGHLDHSRPRSYAAFIAGFGTANGSAIDVSFLNRVLYEDRAPQGHARGDWFDVDCGKSCASRYVSYLGMDAGPPDGGGTYTWTLKNLRAGTYDLWANVPEETVYPGNPAAVYRIKHRSATGVATANHGVVGWHKLAAPVVVARDGGEIEVTLAFADPAEAQRFTIVADAMIAVPRP